MLTAGLLAGYTWLAYVMYGESHLHYGPACFFKSVTGVPCPSCGNTRAVAAIVHGDFAEALYINPLGYIVAGIMLAFPLWIVYDLAAKKDSLYVNYRKFEKLAGIKVITFIFAALIILNWIWNIQKGL